MAQTITAFSIVEVAKPNIGESWPARVRADVTVNLNVQDHIKHEWEGKSMCVCPSLIDHFKSCILITFYICLSTIYFNAYLAILHILFIYFFTPKG